MDLPALSGMLRIVRKVPLESIAKIVPFAKSPPPAVNP